MALTVVLWGVHKICGDLDRSHAFAANSSVFKQALRGGWRQLTRLFGEVPIRQDYLLNPIKRG